MTEIALAILQTYGWIGLAFLVIAAVVYLVWNDKRNNWGSKIDSINDKLENFDTKIDLVRQGLSSRMDDVESRLIQANKDIRQEVKAETAVQTINIMKSGRAGKLSKILKNYCKELQCDHIFLGGFHNGTMDLRGLHYCKFDVLIDEFLDPLHLHKNDVEFCPLYKDENIIAYGDLPYALTHIDCLILPVDDEKNTLLELSDALYRRCKGRDIKIGALAIIKSADGLIVGFIGCVNYSKKIINEKIFLNCAREVEGIYNDNE